MGWDQTTTRESVQQFLLRNLGISLEELLDEAIRERLAEQGLTYKVGEDTSRNEGDLFIDFHPQYVEFSDGGVFVEVLTETDRGDDWGNDYHSFVRVGEPYDVTKKEYLDNGEDPSVTIEEKPGLALVTDCRFVEMDRSVNVTVKIGDGE